MGKTRDLFKKIRDTKGTFHAMMGSIKDRNSMDLTEAEVDVFLEFSCFFYDPMDVGNLILKDDAMNVLHSICQQIWKTQQWAQDWKSSVFIPIPKKGNDDQ